MYVCIKGNYYIAHTILVPRPFNCTFNNLSYLLHKGVIMLISVFYLTKQLTILSLKTSALSLLICILIADFHPDCV